jgi:hypothetical protein
MQNNNYSISLYKNKINKNIKNKIEFYLIKVNTFLIKLYKNNNNKYYIRRLYNHNDNILNEIHFVSNDSPHTHTHTHTHTHILNIEF